MREILSVLVKCIKCYCKIRQVSENKNIVLNIILSPLYQKRVLKYSYSCVGKEKIITFLCWKRRTYYIPALEKKNIIFMCCVVNINYCSVCKCLFITSVSCASPNNITKH